MHKMQDVLVAPAPQSDRDNFGITKNDVSQSISNSVTHDEDDLDGPRKNSEHSIVNSVTNDEDDRIESRTKRDGTAISILPRPINYETAFSTSSKRTNSYRKKNRDLAIREKSNIAASSTRMFKLGSFPERRFDKQSFLDRYEHMMKRQEIEQRSTLSHMQFLLEVFEELPFEENGNESNPHKDSDQRNNLLKEFSFEQLKTIRKKLEKLDEYDIIKIDKQFCMVLDVLCEQKGNFQTIDNKDVKQEKISWAEIVQCYRSCVLGMQTLEIIGHHGVIRKRAKERILATLSLYRNCSFVDSKHSTAASLRASDVAVSKTLSDDHVVISHEVCQAKHHDKESSSSLSHMLGSFIAGMMIASIILCNHSSTTKEMVAEPEVPMANLTQNIACPVVVSEPFSSDGGESEGDVRENTIDPSRDLISFKDDGSSIKKSIPRLSIKNVVAPSAGTQKSNNIALLQSDFSLKARGFDRELKRSVVSNDEDRSPKTKDTRSNDLRVASIVGGAATASFVLSLTSAPVTAAFSWLPMGLTVLIATLAAHGIRDGISSVWKDLRRKKKERKKVFA